MAQGISSYVSFAGSNGYNVRIYFDQVINESAGKSTVSVTKIGIQSIYYAGYSTYVDGIIKINGVEVCKLWNNKGVTNLKNSEWYYMSASGSTTVTHSSDGSASISVSVHANQFSDFNLRSSGGSSYNDRIASGQSRSAILTPVPIYTLSVTAGAGCGILVNRTYSPAGVCGELQSGAKLWKNDKLKITFTPDQNYDVISGLVNNAEFISGNTHTVTGDVTVSASAQPLASTITATDASIGSTSVIVVTSYNQSYNKVVDYSFGELSGRIVSGNAVSTVGWTIPDIFYSQIPNSTSGKCTITCSTYSQDVLIGTSSCEITITVNPDLCKPSLSATVSDIDPETTVLTGNASTLIRYMSDAHCSVTAGSNKYATLSSVTVNNQSLGAGGSYTYVDTSETDFVFNAIDSRGYGASTIISPVIIPYIRLTINPIIERPDPTTQEMMLTFSGNYYNGSFGAYRNTLTVRYRHRAADEAVYSSWATVPSSAYAIGTSSYYTPSPFLMGNGFDYQRAYVFEVQAYDGANGIVLDSVSVEYPVKKGIPVFDWGECDFSFNVPVKMNSNGISGLPELTEESSPSSAVRKDYVDAMIEGCNERYNNLDFETSIALDNLSSDVRKYTDDVTQDFLHEVLVWENASPSSNFGAYTIMFPTQTGPIGELVGWKIEYYFIPTNSESTIICESKFDAAGHRAFGVNYTSSGVGIVFRHCKQNGPRFEFEEAKLNGSPTNAMNPVRIWAVYKGRNET